MAFLDFHCFSCILWNVNSAWTVLKIMQFSFCSPCSFIKLCCLLLCGAVLSVCTPWSIIAVLNVVLCGFAAYASYAVYVILQPMRSCNCKNCIISAVYVVIWPHGQNPSKPAHNCSAVLCSLIFKIIQLMRVYAATV